MCKKAKELIRKQQIPRQMSWYVATRTCSKEYGMLETFMINSIWLYLADLKQCLPTDFTENLLARKKIQIKAWYRILGTEILSYEEFHCKTM